MNTSLLRSSPAVGTSSYGAVPTLASSGLSGLPEDAFLNDSDSDVDVGAGAGSNTSDMSDGYQESALHDSTTALPQGYASIPRKRRKSRVDDVDGGASVSMDGEDPKDHEYIEDSPYSEVRASVSPYDDMTLSINTPRMWVLSILFSLIGSSTNLFFSLRYPSVSITPVIALLLAHPLGKLWDTFFPEPDPARDGKRKGLEKVTAWLGQGRWNRKEHCCVYISSNVSFGFAFATDVIVEQVHFYKQDFGIVYQILLTLSTQILGYTCAGLTRQWLVYPASMIWPSTLMSTAMFTTLHGEENKPANGWHISRWKFFMFIFWGSFAWYFLPGLLAPFLSYFNVVTWINPKSAALASFFGVSSGLGMFPVTFDWAQISYIGSPLMTPWWAAANVVAGLMLVMWIAAPLMYLTNSLYSGYMPILSSAVFDNTGKPYDVSKILTKHFLFDEKAYKNYSKVFLPITYALSYGVQFAALTALVTHTICWHGKDIWKQWKLARAEMRGDRTVDYQPIRQHSRRRSSLSSVRTNTEDVHMRLMRQNYKEVPASWYLATFVCMVAVGIFVVEYYPIFLPWYGLLLALGICAVFFVPIGIVMAITNQQSSLFLICQLICGTFFPGRPVANMVFVTYGYITSMQGLKFSSDLKLGHYMKIPPRILFAIQMVATVVASLTQIGVLNWMFNNIKGICTPYAVNGFTCPIARVHFNGSILWGVVGPQRFFGQGELYRPLYWGFFLGAIGPVLIWAYARKKPKSSKWRKVSLPVVLGSITWIPPATGLNFSSWAIICYIFNLRLRRKAEDWWSKYTMVLSAALDAGLAFGLLVIFFGVVFPGFSEGWKWWGTEVYKEGCDWQACPLIPLAPGETFGPKKW